MKVNKKSLVIGSIGLITWMLFGILAPVVVSIISFVYPVLQVRFQKSAPGVLF